MIDINVWLAITWERHPQHAAALRWFTSADDGMFLFCRLTMLGFLRLLTNRQVMGDSTVTLDEAVGLYDQWMRDPRVELATEPRGCEGLLRQALALFSRQPATKAVADCYLVAFAEGAGAQLVTFDKGLAATAQFRRVPVGLLQPVADAARASAKAKERRGRTK